LRNADRHVENLKVRTVDQFVAVFSPRSTAASSRSPNPPSTSHPKLKLCTMPQ
jgi:hypothetical protein